MADSQPTPATDINDNSSQSFTAMQIVTASCHAVLNTQFIAPDPKPEWFDELNAELDAAKALATEWVDDLAPEMTAGIPSQVINYGTTYDALTQSIIEIADAHPTASGKDDTYVQEVFQLVDALHTELEKLIAQVGDMQDRLTDWGDRMQKAHDALQSGSASIQSAETDLQADINKMNNAIATLNATIKQQNEAIAVAAIGVGVGIFAMIAGVALAPVTGGYSLIATAVGAVTVVGGAVTWGVMQSKINDEFDEIAEDQKRLDADQRQIVALQGLSAAANSAVSSTALATQALSDVKTMWQAFKNDLKGVLDKLDDADESLMLIVNESFIKAAQTQWNLAVEYANDLTKMNMPVEAKTLDMAA